MTSTPATSRPAAPKAQKLSVPKPKVPSLFFNEAGGHEYAIVYWKGQRFSLGRRDDPAHATAYRRFVAHVLAHGVPPAAAGEEPHAPSYVVAELVAQYLDHAATYYRHEADGKPTSTTSCVRAASKPLLENFSVVQARDFGLAELRAYREVLIAAGMSRTTCNSYVHTVRKMFAWAAELERIPPEVGVRLRALQPLKRGRSAAVDLPPRQPVEEEVMDLTLKHAPRPLAGLLRTLWFTGMRVGEACQLATRYVDMTGDVWVFRPAKHKAQHHGKDREIPIGPEAKKTLREFVRLEQDQPWFSPCEVIEAYRKEQKAKRKSKDWPSHQRRRERMRKRKPKRAPRDFFTSRGVAQMLVKTIDAANAAIAKKHAEEDVPGKPYEIPHWSSHQLRHAALTRIRKKFGIEAAQAIGGHSCIAMTEHYSGGALRHLARTVMQQIG